MSRIRTVKPDYWSSAQVMSCSPVARLLFIGLWNFSDDHGIRTACYISLKAQVFPGDNFSIDQIKQWVNELLSNGLLREYAAEGQLYWIVTGFKKHQRIDKPTYRYPLPEADLKRIADHSTTNLGAIDNHSERSRLPLDESSSNTRRVIEDPSTTEGKGMESKGKEDICEVETSPCSIPDSDCASTPSEVDQVFQHWQQVMGHPKARLDKARRQKIEKALKNGYIVSELKQAIDGCSLNDFYMGQNDRGKRYDSIDLILRDADHIDGFIADALNPPAGRQVEKTSQPDWMGYAE